ncbi:hypothetical protein IE53DRAFT_371101 [Violaceomyces palustris]|uniref:Uncharacterized protein n=1 Tax=Violaceomyces palustris TaxID=1673888 RepID=A0ACD0NPX0_9BASI|nr:hypothetical protein IE53DRAFT_371101 [Violaceomyces palustris]
MGEGPMGSFRIGLEETRSDRILIQEAVSKAEESDLVLVLTATGPEWETEGMDRKDLKLPRQQESLLERLSRAHQEKVVVFNLTGAPVEMDWALDRRLQAELLGKEEEDCFTIPTVVQMWFPGQEGGRAMADVLLGLGQAPASGRMSSTWPLRIQDHASYSEDSSSFPGTILRSTSSGGSGTSPTSVRVDYKEGKYTGYNHYLSSRSERRPLFWFGQGLGGYTRFQQRLVGTSGELTPSPGSQVVVEVEVENLGERGGKEVIQIYSILPCSAKDRGYTKLAAFETVRLQAKERKVVRLKLEQESFSSWQEQAKPDGWKVDKGKYTFSLSRSSDPDSEIERFTVEVGQSWRWGGLGHLE